MILSYINYTYKTMLIKIRKEIEMVEKKNIKKLFILNINIILSLKKKDRKSQFVKRQIFQASMLLHYTVVTKNVTFFTDTLTVRPMNSGMIINRLLALWQIEFMICVV